MSVGSLYFKSFLKLLDFSPAEIEGLIDLAADLKAKISFDDHGEKILILKYAKIRAVDPE